MPAGRAVYGVSGFAVVPDRDVSDEVESEEAGLGEKIALENRIDRAKQDLVKAERDRRAEQARDDLTATGAYTDAEVEELVTSLGLTDDEEEPT